MGVGSPAPRLKAIAGLALILVLAGLLVSESRVFSPNAAGSDPPIHIHLTWQGDTGTTITVTWQTSLNTGEHTVLYDVVSRGGVPGLYEYSASGTSYTYSGASGYMHDVELTGLTPGGVYYFICGGDSGGWSSERVVRTAPAVSSDVRFVVGGDSRANLTERAKISQAMAKCNPAFVMHSGDMVNDGRVQSQWDNWFMDVHDNWVGEDDRTIPILPVVGNHEHPNDATTKYFVQFALPDTERWTSYNWGPDIHVICLDCYSSVSGEQLTWLQNDLAAHADYAWKFVMFHEPPFVSGSHTPWMPGRAYWVPLFEKYHVNVVFNGHEHSYQRSYPLNWTASQTEPQDYSNGTMYIISGGWGAPLHTPTPIWYMAYQNKTYNFVVVDVFQNGTLHVQAKDNVGHTFDEVTIAGAPRQNAQLLARCEPHQATYARGQSVDVAVTVLNQLNPPLNSTLTWTVTGPTGYYYFDTQPIRVAADAVDELHLTWTIPDVAGTYVIDVSLIPPQLTAYDAVWLEAQ